MIFLECMEFWFSTGYSLWYKIRFHAGFSLNGELLMDSMGSETAFTEVSGEEFVPAFTLGVGQKAKLNFGQDVNTLKYFTSCGLQEGYEPFCVYV